MSKFTSSLSRNTILAYVVLALLMLGAMRVFENPRHPSLRWLITYVSGAANYEFGQGWRFNENDVTLFQEIPTWEGRTAHRTEPSDPEQLISWKGTTKGYLFVILLARTLFPWMGDLDSVLALQQIVHILVTIAVSLAFSTTRRRVAFCVLFGLNPLILHIVTYPYYYYWQSIPSAFLVAHLVKRDLKFGRYAFLLAILLSGIYVVRPTILFLSVVLFALIFLRESRVVACGALALFLLLAIPVLGGNDHSKDPWHTAYTGVGAYPNPYGLTFRDFEGNALFERKTGRKFDQGVGGDVYHRPEVRAEYSRYEKEAFLEIAREHPFMVLRNATLNFFQAFSIGYVNASLSVSYLSSLTGLGFLGLLLWQKRWGFAIAIAAASPFVIFSPPVHIYMFGGYILIVAAAVEVLGERVEPWLEARAARAR